MIPDQKTLFETWPILGRMNREEEVVWVNPDKLPVSTAKERSELSMKDIDDTEARLKRFAPFIMRAFPETEARTCQKSQAVRDEAVSRTAFGFQASV